MLRIGLLTIVLAFGVAIEPALARPVVIKSPGGGVVCLFDRSGEPTHVYCDWARADDHGVEVRVRGRARRVPAGGFIMPQGIPVLGYGETKRVGKLRCASRRAGMRCWSRVSEHGFRVREGRAPKFF